MEHDPDPWGNEVIDVAERPAVCRTLRVEVLVSEIEPLETRTTDNLKPARNLNLVLRIGSGDIQICCVARIACLSAEHHGSECHRIGYRNGDGCRTAGWKETGISGIRRLLIGKFGAEQKSV